jgi:hypothetical protein
MNWLGGALAEGRSGRSLGHRPVRGARVALAQGVVGAQRLHEDRGVGAQGE